MKKEWVEGFVGHIRYKQRHEAGEEVSQQIKDLQEENTARCCGPDTVSMTAAH